MTIQRQITVHGFLARFSDDGQTLQGAQIEEIERLIDDSNSTVLATRLLDPRPVLPGDAETLAMVAGTINTAALADVAAKDAALTQAQADLAAAQSALAASQSAQAALQARLDALTGGVIDGVPQSARVSVTPGNAPKGESATSAGAMGVGGGDEDANRL